MTALAMNGEILASRTRFRRMLAVSFGVHAVLLAWLVLHRVASPRLDGIVDVTWLEPSALPPSAPPAAPPPAAVAPEPEPVTRLAPQPKPEQKFLRAVEEEVAAVEPVPQEDTASRDRLKQRLETLRSSSAGRALQVAPTSSRLLAAAVSGPGVVPGGTGKELRRESSFGSSPGAPPGPPPSALRRGSGMPSRAAATLAQIPTEAPRATAAAAAAPNTEAVARRSLAGVDIVGEVADRPIVAHALPVYPEWAKEQAIEGTVTLRFFVLPDGRVKENVQVDRTAGFADFDANAVRALAQWRFAPLAGSSAEQWGTVTFNYRLRG